MCSLYGFKNKEEKRKTEQINRYFLSFHLVHFLIIGLDVMRFPFESLEIYVQIKQKECRIFIASHRIAKGWNELGYNMSATNPIQKQ